MFLQLSFGFSFFPPQPFLIGRDRSSDVRLYLLGQYVAMVGEELAAFLQRQT